MFQSCDSEFILSHQPLLVPEKNQHETLKLPRTGMEFRNLEPWSLETSEKAAIIKI